MFFVHSPKQQVWSEGIKHWSGLWLFKKQIQVIRVVELYVTFFPNRFKLVFCFYDKMAKMITFQSSGVKNREHSSLIYNTSTQEEGCLPAGLCWNPYFTCAYHSTPGWNRPEQFRSLAVFWTEEDYSHFEQNFFIYFYLTLIEHLLCIRTLQVLII